MLLTVLMPVYNGAPYLDALLGLFAQFISTSDVGKRFANSAEIVVVNNRSKDDTHKVAQRYLDRIPNLRVIDEKEHVPTAEENVFRSFANCKGRYIWVLGVDDLPVWASMGRVLSLLEEDSLDFLIFNNPIVDNGQVTSVAQFYITGDRYEDGLPNIAQRFGVWFLLAGMSGQILRAECIKEYDFAGLIKKTSLIYSHCIAYLECFTGKRSALVNLPLVFYSVTYRDIAHWKRAAATLGVCDQYFWTVGFLRQLEYLEGKGIIPRDFIVRAMDVNDLTFFRPISVVLEKLREQLHTMSGSKDSRNQMSTEDFYFVQNYIGTRDPLARDIIWSLSKIFATLKAKDTVQSDAWLKVDKAIENFRKSYLFSHCFERTFSDYEIYGTAGKYFAVHRQHRKVLVDRLRHVGEEDYPPFVISAESVADLESNLHTVVAAAKLDGANWPKPAEASHDDLVRIRDQYFEAQLKLEEIYRSRSWLVTAPIRKVTTALRKLRAIP